MTRFVVLTLFPEMFSNFANVSIIKRAIQKRYNRYKGSKYT